MKLLNLPNRRYARGLLLLAFSLLLISFSLVSAAVYALSLPAISPAGFNPGTSNIAPANSGGGSNDWVANAPAGKLIGEVIGTLATTGLISEKSRGSNNTDAFGLQINSNYFPVTYYGKSTTGWEQFVLMNGFAPTSAGPPYGHILIAYWLKDYYSVYGSCPPASEDPPGGGSGWVTTAKYAKSCLFITKGASFTPDVPAKNLGLLTFSAYATGSEEGIKLCGLSVGSGCITTSVPATVLNLYENWHQAEFNVFGMCCGDQAIFNSGTTIQVKTELLDDKGVSLGGTAQCVIGGITVESNNLNLAPTCSQGNSYVEFTESNALETLTTAVASGSGFVSPNCPEACSEEFGSGTFFRSPVTVTAIPSSGWQFSSWSTQEGISCSTNNTCTFSMPLNAVTLKAAFDPVMTSTSQATQTSRVSSQLTIAPIPGFPWESIITGFVLGLVVLAIARERRRASVRNVHNADQEQTLTLRCYTLWTLEKVVSRVCYTARNVEWTRFGHLATL